MSTSLLLWPGWPIAFAAVVVSAGAWLTRRSETPSWDRTREHKNELARLGAAGERARRFG